MRTTKRLSLKDQFLDGWVLHGLKQSDIEAEYQFHMFRRWRLDLAFPSEKVGIELDGFGYGHQSVVSKKRDNEKQNAAVSLGWRVLRFGPDDLKPGTLPETIEMVCKLLCGVYE